MLGGAGRYFYDRRRGLAKTAGLLGAAYLAGQYAVRRLEEIREKVVRDNVAREKYVHNKAECGHTD